MCTGLNFLTFYSITPEAEIRFFDRILPAAMDSCFKRNEKNFHFSSDKLDSSICIIPSHRAEILGNQEYNHFVVKGLQKFPWQSQSLTNLQQLLPGFILEIE